MKAHFFDPINPISIIGFVATFNLACDTNAIYESAAIWLLPFFVKNILATTLNSRMPTAAYINLVAASVSTTEPLIQKHSQRQYPKVVNCLLMKLANYEAIAELDSKIYCHMRPAHMTAMQYANDPYAKSCKIVYVYEESTLNEIFIEGVDPTICH